MYRTEQYSTPKVTVRSTLPVMGIFFYPGIFFRPQIALSIAPVEKKDVLIIIYILF